MMQVTPYNNTRSIGNTESTIYVSGFIFDSKTELGIIDASIQLVSDPGGTPLTQVLELEGTDYEAWSTGEQAYRTAVLFKAPGYKDKTVKLSDLYYNGADVYLDKKDAEIPLWVIGAVLGAALFILKKKKKADKKVGFLDMSDIMPIFFIVGGIIAFDLIKKVLEKLGLWKSPDTKELDDMASDPNSAWSPNFYKTKPANASWTYPITTSTADQYAKDIYNSFGGFNDCEECVKAVFKKLRTKSNLSFLAEIFEQKYDSDLLDFVRGGWWPQDRLSDADVAEINRYIKQLPNW
jgi:hypothetical protein